MKNNYFIILLTLLFPATIFCMQVNFLTALRKREEGDKKVIVPAILKIHRDDIKNIFKNHSKEIADLIERSGGETEALDAILQKLFQDGYNKKCMLQEVCSFMLTYYSDFTDGDLPIFNNVGDRLRARLKIDRNERIEYYLRHIKKKYSFDFNYNDYIGFPTTKESPLHYAATHLYGDLTSLLINDLSARVDLKNECGRTPLQSMRDIQGDESWCPKYDVVKKLLSGPESTR